MMSCLDCTKKQEALEKRIDALTEQEQKILLRQDELKKMLYARFGDSINLES